MPTEFCAGCPDISPFDVPMESPEGSPLALNLYGLVPPVAAIEAEYEPPAIPLARLVVLMTREVGFGGGFPAPDGGAFVTFPHPATKAQLVNRRRYLEFCMVSAPEDLTQKRREGNR